MATVQTPTSAAFSRPVGQPHQPQFPHPATRQRTQQAPLRQARQPPMQRPVQPPLQRTRPALRRPDSPRPQPAVPRPQPRAPGLPHEMPGVLSPSQIIIRDVVRGATPEQIAPVLDAYLARQQPVERRTKFDSLRDRLKQQGVTSAFLVDTQRHLRIGAPLRGAPPLDTAVGTLTVGAARALCYELVPSVRAALGGWRLRVDRLDVYVAPRLEDMRPAHSDTKMSPAAVYTPYAPVYGPRDVRDLWRGSITLSAEAVCKGTWRELRALLVHEMVHAAQHQNFPSHGKGAWEFTVRNEGHARYLQNCVLGPRAAPEPTAYHTLDASFLMYVLGTQVFAALRDRADLTMLLYTQADLMQLILGRPWLPEDVYFTRLRTPQEMAFCKHQLAYKALEMGFTKAE